MKGKTHSIVNCSTNRVNVSYVVIGSTESRKPRWGKDDDKGLRWRVYKGETLRRDDIVGVTPRRFNSSNLRAVESRWREFDSRCVWQIVVNSCLSVPYIYIYIYVPSVRIPVILGKTTKRDVNCYRERGEREGKRRFLLRLPGNSI